MDSEQKVINYLKKYNLDDKVLHTTFDSSTVALAAKAFNTKEERIAKSLSFKIDNRTILIVCAGNTKIDNAKYKAEFLTKAVMLSFDEVENKVGFAPGGVCPFGVNDNVEIYLDKSLQKYETVFPACGTHQNAIELSPEKLAQIVPFVKWIDVCKEKEK